MDRVIEPIAAIMRGLTMQDGCRVVCCSA